MHVCCTAHGHQVGRRHVGLNVMGGSQDVSPARCKRLQATEHLLLNILLRSKRQHLLFIHPTVEGQPVAKILL